MKLQLKYNGSNNYIVTIFATILHITKILLGPNWSIEISDPHCPEYLYVFRDIRPPLS